MYQPSLVPAVSRTVTPTTRRHRGRQKYPTTASGFSLLVGAWHFAWLVLALLWPSPATAEPPSTDTQSLSQELKRSVLPLLDRYCLDCHDRETSEGGIDLQQFIDLDDVRRELGAWQSLLASCRSATCHRRRPINHRSPSGRHSYVGRNSFSALRPLLTPVIPDQSF